MRIQLAQTKNSIYSFNMRIRKVLTSLLVASLVLAGGIAASVPSNAASTLTSPTWMSNATVYEVNVRQYTKEGTFNAFSTHLDRLKSLGVKVLWFMPIQPISVKERKGTLGSYYSIADYKGVNPEFGTAADFKTLIDKAHGMGFKIVLDWVANHTGWDNPWITAHPDWYTKDSKGNITWPPGTDWTDVADLNYSSQAMRAEMIASMKYWVDTYDIDGFRCDVAGGVPNDFWNTATATLTAIKPLWMLAESNPGEVTIGTNFTSAYNWPLKDAFNGMGKGTTDSWTMSSEISRIKNDYSKGNYPMNFITNHDENSWSGTEYTRLGSLGAVKAGAVISFTLPGAPLLYTGQEVGMNKMLKFFEKDQVDYPATPSPMTAFYKKLVELKSKSAALAVGAAAGSITEVTTNKDAVIAYVRTAGKAKVLVAVNLSGKASSVKLSWGKNAGSLYDYATNKKVTVASSQTVTLPAWGYKVYTTNVLTNK
jgi:glycosidase